MDEGRKDMTNAANSGQDPCGKKWNEGHNSAMEMIKPQLAKADARIEELEAALRSILQIPNSDAAQGIMKVFAEDALGEKT